MLHAPEWGKTGVLRSKPKTQSTVGNKADAMTMKRLLCSHKSYVVCCVVSLLHPDVVVWCHSWSHRFEPLTERTHWRIIGDAQCTQAKRCWRTLAMLIIPSWRCRYRKYAGNPAWLMSSWTWGEVLPCCDLLTLTGSGVVECLICDSGATNRVEIFKWCDEIWGLRTRHDHVSQSRARRRDFERSACSGCTTLRCRVKASFLENDFSSVQIGQCTFCFRALWIVSSCLVRS